MENLELSKLDIQNSILNIDVVATTLEQDNEDDDIALSSFRKIANSKIDIADKLKEYDERGISKDMIYTKLAALMCYLNDSQRSKIIGMIKRLYPNFKLTNDNIEYFARFNNLMLKTRNKYFGAIANSAILCNNTNIDKAVDILQWLIDCNMLDKITSTFENNDKNNEELGIGLDIIDVFDRAGVKLTCECCGKERKLSRYNIGDKKCKKCLADEEALKYKEELSKIKVNTTTQTVKKTIEIEEKPKLSNNTKPRYIKGKKKKVDSNKQIYLEQIKKQAEAIEEKAKQEELKVEIQVEVDEMSKLIDDLHSDKMWIHVSEKLTSNEIRDELNKFVSNFTTEEEINRNIFKIAALANECLTDGFTLTSILHELHIKNPIISENIKLRDCKNVNDMFIKYSELDERLPYAFQTIIINHNNKASFIRSILDWTVKNNIFEQTDIDDFIKRAEAGETFQECLASCKAKIVCSTCGNLVSISEIRVGKTQCKKCENEGGRKRNRNKKIKEETPVIENSNTDEKLNEHDDEHVDITSSKIKDFKQRTENTVTIDNSSLAYSKLMQLTALSNELIGMNLESLKEDDMIEVHNQLCDIIDALIIKQEELNNIINNHN